MAANEVFGIFINIDDNVPQLTSNLYKAEKAAASLTAQLNAMNVGAANSLNSIQKAFHTAMTASGYYHGKIVDVTHSTQIFNKKLAEQKLTFGESISAMKGYGKQQSLINRGALENVRMLQSQAVAFKKLGSLQAGVYTAPAAAIDGINNKMLLQQQRLLALNAAMRNASTAAINWGKNTQWAGRQIMVGAGLPLAAFGAMAAVTYNALDKELVRITKVYGDTMSGQQIDKASLRNEMTNLAKEMATTYGMSFEETLSLTADIAATGQTGRGLEAAVTEATRLSVLGEVDKQQAMKATLSLQTAFNKNSKELADTINFLNAAENATSTSLQDIVEAIPRVGPVIKSLGGDVEDLTVFITAMREGGVSAAEGANALKSGLASIIAPSKEAKNSVAQLGVDLDKVLEERGLLNRLTAFQTQLQQLDTDQQQFVIAKLFGKYQMARMSALFRNLRAEGSQTNTILEIMGESAEERAQKAQKEIEDMTQSISGQFKIAVQEVRLQFAEMGESFLSVAGKIVKVVGSIVEKFNGLNDVVKNSVFWGLAFIAAIGGARMLIGVFANLFGTIGNMIAAMQKFYAMSKTKNFGEFKIGFGDKYKQATEESLATDKFANALSKSSVDISQSNAALRNAINALGASVNSLVQASNTTASTVNRALPGMPSFANLQRSGVSKENRVAAVGMESYWFNRKSGDRPEAFHAKIIERSLGTGKKADLAKEALVQRMATESAVLALAKDPITNATLSSFYKKASSHAKSQKYAPVGVAGLKDTQKEQALLQDLRAAGLKIDRQARTFSLSAAKDVENAFKTIFNAKYLTEAEKKAFVKNIDASLEQAMVAISTEFKKEVQRFRTIILQEMANISKMPKSQQKQAMSKLWTKYGYNPSAMSQTLLPQRTGGAAVLPLTMHAVAAGGIENIVGFTSNEDKTNIRARRYNPFEATQWEGGHTTPAAYAGSYSAATVTAQGKKIQVGLNKQAQETQSAASKYVAGLEKSNVAVDKNTQARLNEILSQEKVTASTSTLSANLESMSRKQINAATTLDALSASAQRAVRANNNPTIGTILPRQLTTPSNAARSLASGIGATPTYLGTSSKKSPATGFIGASAYGVTANAYKVGGTFTGPGLMTPPPIKIDTQKVSANLGKLASGAAMGASSLMMFSGQLGDVGKSLSPVMMGATAGMMFGAKGALIGMAAGLGVSVYNDYKKNTDRARKAFEASAVAAEILGVKLNKVSDIEADAFIKAMTDSAEAANEARTALEEYAKRLKEAPEDSPEKALIERLQDLESNTNAEKIGFGGGVDLNLEGQRAALLTQQYSMFTLMGASPEEAKGMLGAIAIEAGISVAAIDDVVNSLKDIDGSVKAIDGLLIGVRELENAGNATAAAIRKMFSTDIMQTMNTSDFGYFIDQLSMSEYGVRDLSDALKHGSDEQKALWKMTDELAQKLNIDFASALTITQAKLRGVNIDAINLANSGLAFIRDQIARVEAEAQVGELYDSFSKKIAKSVKKTSGEVATQSVDDAQEASDARIDAAQKASEEEIKAMEEAAKKRQEAMQDEIDSVKKKYDDEIDAINNADKIRQDAFDKEQKRIERQKAARASEIDYLRAMSEGRYYDAAAIKNEMQSQQEQWALEDREKRKSDKSEKKIAALEEERDSKVDALQTAYDKQVELDQKALEAKREADQAMLEQLRDAEAKRLEEIQKTNDKINASNDSVAEHSEKVLQKIMDAAQKGPGALKKMLKKYDLTMDEAFTALAKRAGLSGLETAELLSKNLKDANWKLLAKGIEAKLNDNDNAESYFNRFKESLGVETEISNRSNAVNKSSSMPQQTIYRAYGGYISGSGTGTSDSIPARLSNGEYVIKASTVKRVGVSRLNKLNQSGDVQNFAAGGLAGSVSRVATWDYIQSKIDQKVKDMKAARDALQSGDFDAAGFTMAGVPKGKWGLPSAISAWKTYDGHGYARDYQTPMGTPIYSVGPGKVVGSNDGVNDNPPGYNPGSNSPSNWVLVWHRKNGKRYTTYYQHLKKNSVKVEPGDIVDHSTMLGRSGNSGNSTGPHLHFEVREGWHNRYTGPWNEAIQQIWKLAKGGLIGQEGNPIPDGPRLPDSGIVSGFTNTQLKELVSIYARLGMSKTQAESKASNDMTESIDSKINKKSPEYAKQFARSLMMKKYGWGQKEWQALEKLWTKESGWKWYADNPTSDAYGIPQSLPGSKMSSAGKDWKTNPETQVKWGLSYIKSRYGSPLEAWAHSQATNWYRDGGLVIPALRKGATINYDNTLANLHRGETVLTAPLTQKLKDGVSVASGGQTIYNVNVNFERASIDPKEAENIVYGALDRHEAAVGRRR